jgi:hypothetical protein
LGGKRQSRFFADAKFKGKTAALKAAKAYRDTLLTRRRVPKPQPRPILIDRGSTQSYQIRIPKPGGGTTTTEFSVTRHGARKAKQMALDAWKSAMR